jgi:hypothetical protein
MSSFCGGWFKLDSADSSTGPLEVEGEGAEDSATSTGGIGTSPAVAGFALGKIDAKSSATRFALK